MMVVMVLPKEPEVLGNSSNPGRDSYSTQVEEEKYWGRDFKEKMESGESELHFKHEHDDDEGGEVMKNSQN